LRGLVAGKLTNAAPEKSPFANPDPNLAETNHRAAVHAVRADAAKSNPVVRKAVASGIPENVAAGIYAREFGGK